MKILFLTRRFFPQIGGVEKHVLQVSEELVKHGHEIVIVAESFPDIRHSKAKNYQSRGQSDTHNITTKKPVKSIQSEIFEPEAIKIYRLKFGKADKLQKVRIWLAMLTVVPEILSADIIQCHDVFIWYMPYRSIFFWKKVFTTFHGYETQFPPRLGAKIVRKISEALSDGNICVGRYIEKWYGTKADYVTYGGVEISNIKNQISNTKRKTVRILFLGRLEEDNGISVYLDALKVLKDKRFSYSFIAVGDGKMRKKVEKMGKTAGFVQNTHEYINNSDIVFASSYLSILESLVLKKKVFAVYTNELKKDYLEMSPFSKYIDISSSAEELAQGILEYKKQNDAKAYSWAKDQTWKKVTDMYLKLWRSK